MTAKTTTERRREKGAESPGDGAPAGGRTAGARGPRRVRTGLLALLALLAAGCATGGTDAEPGTVEAARAAADSAAAAREEETAARRAASDRLVVRGRTLMEAGRDEEAAGVLERAVRRDPSNGHAYLALARARVRLGETASAVGLLERAASLLREDDPGAAAQADSLRAALEAPEGRPD